MRGPHRRRGLVRVGSELLAGPHRHRQAVDAHLAGIDDDAGTPLAGADDTATGMDRQFTSGRLDDEGFLTAIGRHVHEEFAGRQRQMANPVALDAGIFVDVQQGVVRQGDAAPLAGRRAYFRADGQRFVRLVDGTWPAGKDAGFRLRRTHRLA
jgi:hypothetical protein